MTMRLRATYEQGVLRLANLIALEDGASVDVIVMTEEPAPAERLSRAEILARVAAPPIEQGSDGLSGKEP